MKYYIVLIMIALLLVVVPIISQEEDLPTFPKDEDFKIPETRVYQIEGYEILLDEGSWVKYTAEKKELYVGVKSNSLIVSPTKKDVKSSEIKIDYVTNPENSVQIRTREGDKALTVHEKISWDDNGFFLENEAVQVGGTFNNPEIKLLNIEGKAYVDTSGQERTNFEGTYLSVTEKKLVYALKGSNEDYTLDNAPLLKFSEDTKLINREDGDEFGIYLIEDTTVSIDRTDPSLKPITTVKGGQAIIRQDSIFLKKDGENVEIINKLGVSVGRHKDSQGNLVLPFSTTSPMVIKFQDEDGDPLMGGEYTYTSYSRLEKFGHSKSTYYELDKAKSYDISINNFNGMGIIEEGKEIGEGSVGGTRLEFARRITYNDNSRSLNRVHGIELSVGEVEELRYRKVEGGYQQIEVKGEAGEGIVVRGKLHRKPLSALDIPESHKNAMYDLLQLHLGNLNEDNLGRIDEITIHRDLQNDYRLLSGKGSGSIGGYYIPEKGNGGLNLDFFSLGSTFVHEGGHGIDFSLNSERDGITKLDQLSKSRFYQGSKNFDDSGSFGGWIAINTANPGDFGGTQSGMNLIVSSWDKSREISLRDGGSVQVPQLTAPEAELLQKHLGDKWTSLFQGPGFGYTSLYASTSHLEDVAESFKNAKIQQDTFARLINEGTHVEGGYDLNTRLRLISPIISDMDLNSQRYKKMETELQPILDKYSSVMFDPKRGYNVVVLDKLNALVRGGYMTSPEAQAIRKLAEELGK